MEKCSVMIDAWEIQCCGERFKCGEFVKWRVERFDKAMESYPEAGVIDYYYENHPTKTSGYYVLTGVVADIEVLFTHLVPDSSKAGKWLKRSDSYKKPVKEATISVENENNHQFDGYIAHFDELGIPRATYNRLQRAVDDGIVPRSVAFSQQNRRLYKHDPDMVDNLIRTWSGGRYKSPFADREIDLSQYEFEEIVHEAAQITARVEGYEIDGTTVHVDFESNSRRQSWGATYDFNDNGRITGNFSCRTQYVTANAPRFFGENIKKLIRRLLDEKDSV